MNTPLMPQFALLTKTRRMVPDVSCGINVTRGFWPQVSSLDRPCESESPHPGPDFPL